MSLRVNLILVEEQRSGSKLNLKSFLRISSIIAPLLVTLLIAQQGLSSFILQSQLNLLESQWHAIQPKQKQAIRLASRMNFNLKTKAELDRWASAKPSWNRCLASVMESVPDAIQLTSLQATLVKNNETPSKTAASLLERTYRLTLEGKSRAENSMVVVQTLEKNILTHPEMAALIESADVTNFAADMDSSNTLSRIFTIECKLLPLPLKEKH